MKTDAAIAIVLIIGMTMTDTTMIGGAVSATLTRKILRMMKHITGGNDIQGDTARVHTHVQSPDRVLAPVLDDINRPRVRSTRT